MSSSPAPPLSDIAAQYERRAEQQAAHAEHSAQRARWISHARLIVFLALVLAGSWAASAAPPIRAVAIAVTALLVAAFIALVVMHRRARSLVEWHEELRTVNELGAKRVRRAWNELPTPRVEEPPPTHPYAADLDIVGHASLLQLLDVVSSAPGRPTLVRWLLDGQPTADEIRARQAAAAELAPQTELREALHALARMAGPVRPESLERFLTWAETPPWLLEHRATLWGARVVPVATLVMLVLAWAGVVSWIVVLAPIILGLLILAPARAHLEPAIAHASATGASLASTTSMLERLERATFTSPRLVNIQHRLATGGGAAAQLRRLGRAMAWAEVRYSPMMHSVLQAVALWDVHVVARLERWQVDAGARARDWLASLGEAESLAALATLANDNPQWAFPEIRDDGDAVIDATALAHPLLPDATRVANDVTIGPRGTCLLITGSNMSGKSTLLRAIGANVVLAQAGAPVCATSLRLPLVRLYTSIRIQDSLEQGISLFMAELQRLRLIVDAARRTDAEHPLLYLLDEILHGTNTAERQVAARTILGTLIECGAIGAVTTHDLALAAAGPLATAARPVHFSECFTRTDAGTTMTFDYRLRPGLATSVNALRLLEMMGLGEGK
jgi:hypothetical protein